MSQITQRIILSNVVENNRFKFRDCIGCLYAVQTLDVWLTLIQTRFKLWWQRLQIQEG